jgi:uncharacterized membrane-anchored protein
MKKKSLLIAFLLIAIVQLAIPASMIFEQEFTLTEGFPYKFKTQPVDPNDPFRGKYIVLNYDLNEYVDNAHSWELYEDIYVYFKKDASGFAQVDAVSKYKLPSRNDYILTNISAPSSIFSTVHFELPFDRFYMNEDKARPAEKIVSRRNDSLETYALIHLHNGTGVIKEVYVNDVPISEYVEQNQ